GAWATAWPGPRDGRPRRRPRGALPPPACARVACAHRPRRTVGVAHAERLHPQGGCARLHRSRSVCLSWLLNDEREATKSALARIVFANLAQPAAAVPLKETSYTTVGTGPGDAELKSSIRARRSAGLTHRIAPTSCN